MKLSKREKVMISMLAVVVVIYLAYTFGYTNLNKHMNTVENEYDDVHSKYEKAVLAVDSIEKLSEKEIERNKEINVLCQRYYDNMDQENVILYIKEFIDNNNIAAKTLSFTERNLSQNIEQSDSSIDAEVYQETNNQIYVRVTDVNISYEATYNDLINFIDEIQNYEKEISISNMTAVVSDSSKIVGSMSISFYGIENPYSKEKYVWKDVVTFGGRQNPFYSQQSFIEVFDKSSKKYDFSISVKPTSSDLPTVILQKNLDTKSSIYEDSNFVENISVNIKEDNGKYYYNYATTNSKYPVNNEWEEFFPESDNSINIKVYSCVRNSDVDTSGVNISVVNSTDLSCVVDVFDDDRSRPRVQFNKVEGVKINNDL